MLLRSCGIFSPADFGRRIVLLISPCLERNTPWWSWHSTAASFHLKGPHFRNERWFYLDCLQKVNTYIYFF